MTAFVDEATPESWTLALQGYPRVLASLGKPGLQQLDAHLWTQWPPLIAARTPPHITRAELLDAMDWKMKRGAWRGWNVTRAQENSESDVVTFSALALAACPHPRAPLEKLCALKGVGPATASAVLAAVRPDVYAFYDEEVAEQLPGHTPVKFTIPHAVAYMDALREKAAQLGWQPQQVAQALWVVGRLGL